MASTDEETYDRNGVQVLWKEFIFSEHERSCPCQDPFIHINIYFDEHNPSPEETQLHSKIKEWVFLEATKEMIADKFMITNEGEDYEFSGILTSRFLMIKSEGGIIFWERFKLDPMLPFEILCERFD